MARTESGDRPWEKFCPFKHRKNCAFVGARYVVSSSTLECASLHVGTVTMVVGASRRAALPAASLPDCSDLKKD